MMNSHKKVTPEDLKYFQSIVGADYVRSDAKSIETYGKDWTRGFTANPSAVVLPASSKEVSEIVRYCSQKKIAIVPSGGRTGLAAAAYATNGELVLSLERMNKILVVDHVGLSIEVEAGVTTQAVQDEARRHGLFFGLNLGSKGSCQIGGNINTNAGGTKLIRYGGMREQVLGLEMVLADGTILDMNMNLRKNNSGYDLKQLVIGSEGTLGIVTKATLKLMPAPRDLELICMGVRDFSLIPKILAEANLLGLNLTAFEFFSDLGLDLVLRAQPSARAPLSERAPYYVLIEMEKEPNGPNGQGSRLESLVEKAVESELVLDAVVAASSAQFHALWALRENISESISQYGHVRKNDIALPIHKLDAFVIELKEVLKKSPPEIQLVLFGHIGDGNLHINYIAPKTLDVSEFNRMAVAVEKDVFSRLPSFRGSISAEHGIGLAKKSDLLLTRTAEEVSLMRQIKGIFDPHAILNPGKIFD